MNRHKPLQRTAFKRAAPPPRPAKQVTCTPRPREIAVARSDGAARCTVPVPKSPAVRSAALVKAYRLIPCQYEICPGQICGDTPTCCNHSNWAIHGKGRSRKADDNRGASGCDHHHRQLDQGRAWSGTEKKAKWWAAHTRTVRLLVALGHWPADVPVPDIETNPFEATP